MTLTKKKPKEQKITTRKFRRIEENRDVKSLDGWEEAIEKLKASTFESVDEAVSAIAEEVCVKYSTGGKDESEMKKALRFLIESDPEIVSVLKETLLIKKK